MKTAFPFYLNEKSSNVKISQTQNSFKTLIRVKISKNVKYCRTRTQHFIEQEYEYGGARSLDLGGRKGVNLLATQGHNVF